MSDLADLVYISQEAGSRVDYVQAGGGNTSVKFDDGFMAIKASGYLLKDMTESYGFVAVDGELLKRYFEQTQFEQANRLAQNEAEQGAVKRGRLEQAKSEQNKPEQIDRNKESMDMAIASVKSINGEAFARPSVEIGFHSILQKFVLHLHPVYAAVLLCSSGGMEKIAGILEAEGIGCAAVPYIMPGYMLTTTIRDAAAEYEKRTGETSKVIVMKNHGVTTTTQTADEALSLMRKVNDAVIKALSLPPFQSEYALSECKDGYECLSFPEPLRNCEIATACGRGALYPDQLVYIFGEIGLREEENKKITIGERILYRSGAAEAAAMHETLLGVAYVHACIAEKGLRPELLSAEECAQILGWDSEKYRRSLMK